MLSVPIQEAAAAKAFVERAHVFRSGAECRIRNPILLGPAGVSYAAVEATTNVCSYTLRDVVLDANTSVMLQGNAIVADTRYTAPSGYDPHITPSNMRRERDDVDFVIGYNGAHGAYQHWLTQCLPAIDWGLRRSRGQAACMVVPPLADWQEEMLTLLGYQNVSRLTVDAGWFYHLPHVEYAEFLNGKTSFGVSRSMHFTARRLLDAVPDDGAASSVLFVPCATPYYGPLDNEAEAIDFFVRRGATIIHQGMPLRQRLNLFRHAKVVIGPFGAGLADIIFCQPGTLLWEWVPRHHQNASINRLAQTAQVNYWADVFENGTAGDPPGAWSVDLHTVRTRMAEILEQPSRQLVSGLRAQSVAEPYVSTLPIDDIVLAFESLGDNCEFGLVQRIAGAEPLGLLRFAGFPLGRLIEALDNEFDGVGNPENVRVYPAGDSSPREMMVHESSLDTNYHTFINEDEVDPDDLRRRQARQLGFLRRKMLEDLRTGEKIWVWRQYEPIEADRLTPLLERLRRFGPNRLLWVTPSDGDHAPGTIECLASDFVRGYVKRLAPYDAAWDIHAASWFVVCDAAYQLLRAGVGQSSDAAPDAMVPPMPPVSASLDADGTASVSGSQLASSAFTTTLDASFKLQNIARSNPTVINEVVPAEIFDQFLRLRSDGTFTKLGDATMPTSCPSGLNGGTALDRRSLRDMVVSLTIRFIGDRNDPYWVCPFHRGFGRCVGDFERLAPPPGTATPGLELVVGPRRQGLQAISARPCSMLEELRRGGKIVIWVGSGRDDPADIHALFAEVRSRGARMLLWVQPADPNHLTGCVEHAGAGVLKGYLDGAGDGETDASLRQWGHLCASAAAIADVVAGFQSY